MKAHTLISTVGTSLFNNIRREDEEGKYGALVTAFRNNVYQPIAEQLRGIDPKERICGAEINSIADLIDRDLIQMNPPARLIFLHSKTDEGRAIAQILDWYYKADHQVELKEIEGLQDIKPDKFRREGLRNLIKVICREIYKYGVDGNAINATGGYKAQIAVAVMIGQALDVQVYYKFELFHEIISFPPMPIALDRDLWVKAHRMLEILDKENLAEFSQFADEWNPKYECLIDRKTDEGKKMIALSAAGMVFHEALKGEVAEDQSLPPHASTDQKKAPLIKTKEQGNFGKHPEIERFMKKVTDEIPQVIQCRSKYYNRDLSKASCFRVGSEGIECVFSPGGYTAKFHIETTASNPGQMETLVAYMNEWLSGQSG